MKKYIQIFSDGSITFILDNNVNLKKIKISEKDHKNSFFKEKKRFIPELLITHQNIKTNIFKCC